MAHPFPANRRAQMRMRPSARLDRRPDGGLKVGDGEGLLQERCGPKGPRLGPRVLIGGRRDQDEGHGVARALEGRQHVQPARLGQLVVRDDGVVGAPVTNGDAARRQSVLVHRGREVLEELGAIARLRAEQTPRIGVVLRQQEPSLAWGGLGRLEQDSAGLLGNARGLRLLLRPVYERLLEHATCQLQGRGMPTSRVARQWGRFPPNAGPRRKGSLWWGLRTAWGIPPQSRRWTPWMLNVGDRGRGGGAFPAHHTA